jgi:citrate lyase subunit beta-like protein
VCIDYKSNKVLQEECKEGKEWGFTGKQAIHPCQVDIIQKEFSPCKLQVVLLQKLKFKDKALAIIKGYQESVEKGLGAFNLDGIMVDMPVVKWAQKILERHDQIQKLK